MWNLIAEGKSCLRPFLNHYSFSRALTAVHGVDPRAPYSKGTKRLEANANDAEWSDIRKRAYSTIETIGFKRRTKPSTPCPLRQIQRFDLVL